MVQHSHPYMTTGKTIALTIWTFVDKVMSLLFNMLSRFVIDFLPRSKHLLISWLQSPSAVILEPFFPLRLFKLSQYWQQRRQWHPTPVLLPGKSHGWRSLVGCSVVSDSVWPHRRQPTRLPRPWDSPGKNTGVGCHFLLQCMKVKSENEVAQSCPTLATPRTAAYQAPPSMGFSRQEYWSGVPLPSPSIYSRSL